MAANFGEQNESNNKQWKAHGFLNMFLPSADGTMVKLGAIPLKEAQPSEKTLSEWLAADPTRVEKVLSKLVIKYQVNQPSKKGFKLED